MNRKNAHHDKRPHEVNFVQMVVPLPQPFNLLGEYVTVFRYWAFATLLVFTSSCSSVAPLVSTENASSTRSATNASAATM